MVRQDDKTARLPPVSEPLRDEFRDDVRRRYGSVRGHYRHEVETALREYLNASKKGADLSDRLHHIEAEVDRVADTVDRLADGFERKKKKDRDVSKRTRDRLHAVAADLEREAGDSVVVHESVVNRAIEEHAGSSEPTLRRYKRMLKEHALAFENPIPDTSTWFTDEEQFVIHVETNRGIPDDFAHEELPIYGGEEWYDAVYDRVYDDDKDTFERSYQ